MRLIIFFDLPTLTTENRKEYIFFRKILLKEGFIMMQESVYTKLAMNRGSAILIENRIRKKMPKQGLVQMLVVTEKQFSSITNFIGESQTKNIDSTERLVIL